MFVRLTGKRPMKLPWLILVMSRPHPRRRRDLLRRVGRAKLGLLVTRREGERGRADE